MGVLDVELRPQFEKRRAACLDEPVHEIGVPVQVALSALIQHRPGSSTGHAAGAVAAVCTEGIRERCLALPIRAYVVERHAAPDIAVLLRVACRCSTSAMRRPKGRSLAQPPRHQCCVPCQRR